MVDSSVKDGPRPKASPRTFQQEFDLDVSVGASLGTEKTRCPSGEEATSGAGFLHLRATRCEGAV